MRYFLFFIFFFAFINVLFSQQMQEPRLLYGVAYYDEYMPYERLNKDVQMMKDGSKGEELLSGVVLNKTDSVELEPWSFKIIEDK